MCCTSLKSLFLKKKSEKSFPKRTWIHDSSSAGYPHAQLRPRVQFWERFTKCIYNSLRWCHHWADCTVPMWSGESVWMSHACWYCPLSYPSVHHPRPSAQTPYAGSFSFCPLHTANKKQTTLRKITRTCRFLNLILWMVVVCQLRPYLILFNLVVLSLTLELRIWL